MNIAFFLTPKALTAYLYDDCTLRQGLEKLRTHGYTAVPVISRTGRYVGTVTEGDFLWYMVDNGVTTRELERHPLSAVLRPAHNPPVTITATMEELMSHSRNQNFVPVIDDNGNLVGIVRRREVIGYYTGFQAKPKAVGDAEQS